MASDGVHCRVASATARMSSKQCIWCTANQLAMQTLVASPAIFRVAHYSHPHAPMRAPYRFLRQAGTTDTV
ncbi:hypothetical protein [Xanthomonas oryzae pv. oryzae MAFF 311018]|nr:hypothetical protein [Xanthomonas oryzae pv. oryzae MAFF 311018]